MFLRTALAPSVPGGSMRPAMQESHAERLWWRAGLADAGRNVAIVRPQEEGRTGRDDQLLPDAERSSRHASGRGTISEE